jgi:dienelactone hydrolase
MNAPSEAGLVTAIDDGLAIIDHVKALPYVDDTRISVYGVSLGGNLVMFLASAAPTLHAVVAGAPAPIWFLGAKVPTDGSRPDFSTIKPDAEVATQNIAPIRAPILILVGTVDPLLPLDRVLHDELVKHGKRVRMEIYEHGYHDFVLGPQGQGRSDLASGEILLQGALDALERTVAFVETRQ